MLRGYAGGCGTQGFELLRPVAHRAQPGLRHEAAAGEVKKAGGKAKGWAPWMPRSGLSAAWWRVRVPLAALAPRTVRSARITAPVLHQAGVVLD